MSYEIIDNFLDEESFHYITSTFFPNEESEEKFLWNYLKGIVRNPDLGPTGYEEHDWMYSKLLFPPLDNRLEYDKNYSIIKPILKKLNIKKLFDARANLLVPTKEHIYHEFHVDRDIPHTVALFYVTECNGFTILKDVAKVDCIKNRMLIFDGSIHHHSVTSTDDVRCVININFIPHLKSNNSIFEYK